MAQTVTRLLYGRRGPPSQAVLRKERHVTQPHPDVGHSTGPTLARLAAAHGVATRFENWQGRVVEVAPESVVAVLGRLGVDATTPAAARAALAEVTNRPASAGTIVLTEGETAAAPGGELHLEDGSARPVGSTLPTDLPLGYHALAHDGGRIPVIVTPARLAGPPHTWGWMLQLYALHSAGSWGMGDLGDLAAATRRAAADGAGFVLLNPLHAVAPGHPVPASPYSPTSRRFLNPLYLRIADTAAYGAAGAALRGEIDALRPEPGGDLIDYDAVWAAKAAALARLATHDPGATAQPDDPALRDFATYCALAEVHGRDWTRWPEPLRHPANPAVAAARADLAGRVAFHAWLQRLCDEQLGSVRAASAGMAVGVVQDLAVGIDPGGADGWLLQDVLAEGVRVGAPPDAFNQLGQDWGLAAWRPDRLAATGYEPYRDLVRAMLRHAGGLRVDHVAGLWRLWWVPPGGTAADGTYVRYDAKAMVGILALEASRAGAVVVGEDLGTVLPEVTDGLAGRNMLGCEVLWFARDASGGFLPPGSWPVNALGTISTHDLPTAAGYLTGEHVRVRASLSQLTRPEAEERADAAAERDKLLALLRDQGLIGPSPTLPELILALHAFLAATPSRLVAASPYDAVGDVRQPNLPGTVDEYPNWRIPLPVALEDLFDHPAVRQVVAILSARGRSRLRDLGGSL
jgi:4-alpha-glucanotransferase